MPKKTLADLLEARKQCTEQPRPHDPNRVMPAKCGTCPWHQNGQCLELDDQTWFVFQNDPNPGNQYCHSPAWSGKAEDVICRGHRDHWLKFFHQAGLLPEATDQAWADLIKTCQEHNHL